MSSPHRSEYLSAGLASAVLLTLAMQAPVSLAEGAHQHGVARLDVVLDGQQLVIALESPLANLLGFEHAPRNDRQRAAVKKMEAALQAADAFQPDVAAACALTHVSVEHPFKDAAAKGAAADQGKAQHNDADVSWTFACARPEALKRIAVGLFARFPQLATLKAQLAGPRGQSARTLTRRQQSLAW